MDAAGLAISLITLCEKLYKGIKTIKNAPEDIKRLAAELEMLEAILQSVKSTLDGKLLISLEKMEEQMRVCLERLKNLDVNVNAKQGIKARVKRIVGRVTWPWKEDELLQSINLIERLKNDLMIELQVHQVYVRSQHI